MKAKIRKKSFYLFALSLILIYATFKIYSSFYTNLNVKQVLQQPISATDLLDGDIVFWKDTKKDDRAGHVAIVSFASSNIDDLRIAHATDNPKYYAFVDTHILPSKKIFAHDKTYYVLRIKDEKVRQAFLQLVKNWLDLKPIFNAQNEILMNMWDDSMAKYSTKFKLKLQHELFIENSEQNYTFQLPSKQGHMCSEIIILALQSAYAKINGNSSNLPDSLQLDPILCPPSTMMFSLTKDHANFQTIGELII